MTTTYETHKKLSTVARRDARSELSTHADSAVICAVPSAGPGGAGGPVAAPPNIIIPSPPLSLAVRWFRGIVLQVLVGRRRLWCWVMGHVWVGKSRGNVALCGRCDRFYWVRPASMRVERELTKAEYDRSRPVRRAVRKGL